LLGLVWLLAWLLVWLLLGAAVEDDCAFGGLLGLGFRRLLSVEWRGEDCEERGDGEELFRQE
jgi:hypothetical protein